MNPIAHRAQWLPAWLIALALAGLGPHVLAMLVPGEDLTLVRDLTGDRSPALTALAHGASWLGRSVVLVLAAVLYLGGAWATITAATLIASCSDPVVDNDALRRVRGLRR